MTWILLASSVLLALCTAGLSYHNLVYKAENRRLILQNDSLMGANIELSRLVYTGAPAVKDSSVNVSE